MTNEKKARTQADPTDSLDLLIRAEQIRILYRNTPAMLVSNTLIPLVLMYLWWDVVDRSRMLVWLALMLVVVSARAGTYIAYQRMLPSPTQVSRWGTYLVISSFASGSLWGAAGMQMSDPGHPEQFSLMLLIIGGFGAGAVVSLAAYLPVFYAFFFPSLLPFITASLWNGSHTSNVMVIAAIMFLGTLSLYARNLQRVFTQSLLLRFENLDLVKELTAQKVSAERANAAKTRFLAAASHDLRQPLHAMGLFVSALAQRVRGAGTRKLVAQLGSSTEALRGLLNALLDISRLDAGVIQPRFASCSVQNLFDRLAHDYAAAAAEKNIVLTFVPTRVWVWCDATLLERIVRNLVSNAVRYTERGGVVVGCRRRGESLRIEVWDSGIGIAPDELSNIFHEFYQVGNLERDRSKGLGLGLAIAQRLARLLGLQVDVVSVPGKGSMFALAVPRSAAAESEGETPTPSVSGRLPPALVVVIDDELAIREATRVMLGGWGCEAVLADSGDTALAAVAGSGRAPQAIIADYRLRNGETGAHAIAGLHALYGRDIPAIIITGDTAPDRLREAEASGYHLLHKPLAPARLRALLSHVLSGRETAAGSIK